MHFCYFELRNLLKPAAADIGHRCHLQQCLPICLCIWPLYTFSQKSLKVLLCQPHNSTAITIFHVPCSFPFVYPNFPSLSVVALTHLAQHISIRQRRRRLFSESSDVTQVVEFANKSVPRMGQLKKNRHRDTHTHTHVCVCVYVCVYI